MATKKHHLIHFVAPASSWRGVMVGLRGWEKTLWRLVCVLHLGLCEVAVTKANCNHHPTMVAEVWTANQLMGVSDAEQSLGTVNKKGKVLGKGVEEDPMLWGVPGHLTQEEAAVFGQFKEEVEKRGGEFRETVYCFGEIEGECWALCRWLRARKFVLDDVVAMVVSATEVRKDAKAHKFYENPVEALGVDPSLFFAQYPQLYYGSTTRGVPVFISRPGILNVDGMECITTLDGMIKFHWHIMMHDFANRLHDQKKSDPDKFKKFECFCVLDLDKLTTSQLSRRALAIIKDQAAIDSICFPETMSKMLIVNAPTFFAATWRLIKGWLDPRTASKIEVISSRSAMEKRLLEFIDPDKLPSDYGGTAPEYSKILNESSTGLFDRLETKMLYVRGYGSDSIEVPAGETMDVSIYTRSTAGATFTITDADGKIPLVDGVKVTHQDASVDLPTNVQLSEESKPFVGPLKLKIKADSMGSRFTSHNYMIVCGYKKMK